MRILQICFRMPFPLKDGGAIAMFNMTKGFLEAGHEVTLLVPLTSKHEVDLSRLPSVFLGLKAMHTVKINSEVTISGALKNFFTSEPYYISRYEDRKMEQKLAEILENNEFDLIQTESLKMSHYIHTSRKFSPAKMILRSHNVEYLIWERVADSLSAGPKKWYLKNMVSRLKKYEKAYLDHFDAIVPITDHDADHYRSMGCTKPMITAPCGVDLNKLVKDDSQVEPGSVFHLAAMDWIPNQDAAGWLLDEIWPRVTEKFPGLKLYLAGRNMPESYFKRNIKNGQVVGEVEDAVGFMNSKQVMLVPLRSGSGMRIKIPEGMALGKVIISTSIGAEGIDYRNGENILIADSPAEFLEAFDKIQKNRNFAKQISSNAYNLAVSKYDNRAVMANLLAEYEKLINEHKFPK